MPPGFLPAYSLPNAFSLVDKQVQLCGTQWVPTAMTYRLVPRPAGAHRAIPYPRHKRPRAIDLQAKLLQMAPNLLPITPLREGSAPEGAAMSYFQGSCIGTVLR